MLCWDRVFAAGIHARVNNDRTLLIRSEGSLLQYYAPFDYVSDRAEIVIVGLTPGRQQMDKAWSVARYLRGAGKSELECKSEALRLAAFCGAMRQKLVNMLDVVGVARYLRIPTASLLWEKEHFGRAQFLSVAQNPVLNNNKDYSGYGPNASDSELLFESFRSEAFPTLLNLSKPTICLGRAAEAAVLSWTRDEPLIEKIEWLFMPHTSGNSAGRPETFLSGKPQASNIKQAEFDRIMDQRRRLAQRFGA